MAAKEPGAGGREAAASKEVVLWREEARRFETPDCEAYLQYRLLAAAQPRSSSGGGGATQAAAVMEMAHTYVPGSKRGRGLAARLCDAAFAHARERGMRVLPTCSYISVRS